MTELTEREPLERFLDRLEAHACGPRASGSSWTARCPAHDDRNPSLSIAEGEDGRVLVKCHAGCTTDAVLDALGLSYSDLFPAKEGEPPIPLAGAASVQADEQGLTLAAYAEAKRLPLDFLRELGLTEIFYGSAPAVRIPYRGVDGSEVAVRFRLSLAGENRFRWRKGSKPMLYGLDRLGATRRAGYVILVEGESDAQTLWLHGLPALGLPGANQWREERDAPLLDGIETVYVVVEPDAGAGRRCVQRSEHRASGRVCGLSASRLPRMSPSSTSPAPSASGSGCRRRSRRA